MLLLVGASMRTSLLSLFLASFLSSLCFCKSMLFVHAHLPSCPLNQTLGGENRMRAPTRRFDHACALGGPPGPLRKEKLPNQLIPWHPFHLSLIREREDDLGRPCEGRGCATLPLRLFPSIYLSTTHFPNVFLPSFLPRDDLTSNFQADSFPPFLNSLVSPFPQLSRSIGERQQTDGATRSFMCE